MDIAKIKDLKVDFAKIASNDVKKKIAELIEQEFSNQSTKYADELNIQRNKELEKYKKSVGFYALERKYQMATLQLKKIEDDIENLGLSISGNAGSTYYNSSNIPKNSVKKAKELQNKLNSLAKERPTTLKNKVLSRLWLASTYGEISVILHEVMGNGIIPKIGVKDLKRIENK